MCDRSCEQLSDMIQCAALFPLRCSRLPPSTVLRDNHNGLVLYIHTMVVSSGSHAVRDITQAISVAF